MSTDYRRIKRDGLWDNNIVFAQALGLCPLLAVTGTASNGLGMGLATLVVLATSGLLVAALRGIISPQVRIPVFVLIIAVLVTLVDMAMNAWMHGLHKILGLFIPLIVTNCAILGRAESFASRNAVLSSLVDGVMMGMGFILALVLLGATREILGSGTLFANASLLLGEWAQALELTLILEYKGFLLVILPPGGFLAKGFLLASRLLLQQRLQQREAADLQPV